MPARKRGQGEGSYYPIASGSWQAAITVHRPDGRATRKYFTGPTKRHVQNMVKVWREEQDRGRPAEGGEITLAAYVEVWLTGRPALRSRASTIHGYRRMLAMFTAPLGGVRLRDLTTARIQTAIGTLAQTYAPQTVYQSRRVLSSALGDAVRDGRIATNPVADTTPPRVPRTKRAVLTADQAAHLLSHAESAGDYRWPLWTLLLNTGLRMGEVMGLRWEDVDTAARRLTVRQQVQRSRGADPQFYRDEPKTETSTRTLPLTDAAVRALERQRLDQLARQLAAPRWANPWNLVFTGLDGRPLGNATAANQFHRALAAAGLPRMRLHDLRHTVATLLLGQGVPMKVISEILGHANIHTTMNLYSHVDQPLMEEALGKLGAAISGRS